MAPSQSRDDLSSLPPVSSAASGSKAAGGGRMQALSTCIRATFLLVQQMLCRPLVVKESLIKFIVNLALHSRRPSLIES